ncbi:glutathione ABC transporter substrate-binding protein [Neobacillus sp. MM2021_6]|uniref:glutathione ABC transporter substrate-binding protein n=1 Tax=Bacillaceae TaxID=186817 RepID=UPI0014090944|nr:MULTISPECIES: glutathione ABC transporter substrate-binding protein [Bacillaceae]MBO0958837.1 glutathione ABC transporter substrate-binding protein [Neobacillus sp. MM2021_6]NHC21394.1 glutathione ABC transporter substrate-binding protein [Bacillus sp. MM2020_4]
MKKAHFWKMLMLVALSAVLIVGCSSKESAGEKKEGSKAAAKEMVIAVNENFISMDPHNTGDTNSNSVQSAMLEGLLGFDPDGKVMKKLAEDYSISENAMEYTFKLRQGVKFHDGEAFNAEAVKANYERIMKDDSLRLNSRGFNLITSIDVINEYEIKITLKEPYAGMLTRFVSAKIISPKLISEGKDKIGKNPIGTGPFKFVEWVQGDHLTVERFDEYWDKKDRVQKISYKPVPENGSRVAMLKTGEAHVIYPLPSQNIKELESTKDVEVEKIPSTIANYVSINTMKKPFDDPRVRQAMNYAVDKDAFIKVVKTGFGLPLDSILPSKTLHYAKQEVYDQKIEKAKQLLKEAGLEKGFKTEIWGNTNSDTMKGMQFIQQQLKAIGIDVEIKSMEEGTLSDEIYGAQKPEDTKLQMWYVSWSAYPSDTTNATKPLFYSGSFPPNGANTAYYKNDQVDQWIEEVNKTADQGKQAEIYGNMQSTIYKDAPWIFLGVDEILAGKRKNVEGVVITPDGGIDVTDANLK